MPELPEVETVVRLLRPHVAGRRIESAAVAWARTVDGSPRAFARAVAGATVERLWRRGKYLVFDLARDGRAAGHLVGHLRMTGRMHVGPPDGRRDPHVRVRLRLDDGYELRFADVRKFGRLVVAADLAPLLGRLGPEPLDDGFTAAALRAALQGRKRMLKPLLLDQSFVAGLGNIYVDESLHLARLHPRRQASSVRPAAATRLHGAIRTTLAAAIEREGSSFDTFYRTPEGRPGRYQDRFRVYGRDGKPCPRCATTVRRIVVAQRGTHVCDRCQRTPDG